ncbi:MAG: NUDIX domain-containing protein [Myxococcales bacterium]|nr:NUDIX domain-containing protein [Myxococcales bacterium]
MPLPPLPLVEIIELENLSPRGDDGFLRLERRRLKVRYPEGDESESFVYDSVARRALDAVVVLAHYADAGGRTMVYLRSTLRPPARLRPADSRPLEERDTLGMLWELPAGLVEADECHLGEHGLRRAGARELCEEIGATVHEDALTALGPATFPSAGVIGERHHFYRVEVRPEALGEPTLDGSVLEERAMVVAVSLDEALEHVRRGDIEDGKTEIALRRMHEAISLERA